jgi:choline dehydrogenase-like flavoprotein
MLSQPISTGSVHITSSFPTDNPILDPSYLSNPIDLEIMARHVLYVNTIVFTEPFRSTIFKEGAKRKEYDAHFDDLEGAKKCVRRRGVSMWHPTSTCAMLRGIKEELLMSD